MTTIPSDCKVPGTAFLSLTSQIDNFIRWLGKQEPPKSPRTVEAYKAACQKLLPMLGETWRNAALATPQLRVWREGQGHLRRSNLISASKTRIEMAALRAFYTYALQTGQVDANPMDGVPSMPPDLKLPRPMPPEDVRRLLAACEVDRMSPMFRVRDRALLECFLNGLRNIEALRLNIRDVQYSAESKSLVLRVMGKGMREGRVVLHPDSASFMARYLLDRHLVHWRRVVYSELPENGMAKLFEVYDEWWRQASGTLKGRPVFIRASQGEARLTRQGVNVIFRNYRTLANLAATYGPHSLRHTCATELLNNDVDIRTVQEVLRHKSITQTELYTKVLEGTKAKAMLKLPTHGAAV